MKEYEEKDKENSKKFEEFQNLVQSQNELQEETRELLDNEIKK